MEQIQQLLEILSQTPQMALWGLGLYFLFMLLKAASWISAIVLIAKMLFKYLHTRLPYAEGNDVIEYFEKNKISNVPSYDLIRLLDALKGGAIDSEFIHDGDIDRAIQAIRKMKDES